MSRKKSRGGDDRCGKEWSKEEPLQSDCHNGDIKLWDEPEKELEHHGDGDVYLDDGQLSVLVKLAVIRT